MFDSYRYYLDLISEIDILEFQIESAIHERESWHFSTGKLGKRYNLDVSTKKMDELAERIEWLTERIEHKKGIRDKIEEKLNSFKGLEYKVAYMRIVEGKKIEKIAEELNYSEDWIKKVSAKITRHLEGTDLLKSMS